MVKKVGFIGTGVMGTSIVKHLLQADYEVTLYTRTKDKAIPLIEEGAIWSETASEAAAGADLIFTMVGSPADVEETYFGNLGIFEGSQRGQIVIDMTTSSPALAKKISEEASNRKMSSIDAPVSGGDIGAKNGTLSIMCGGEVAIFEKVLPVLSTFGDHIVYQGAAGAGQHTKCVTKLRLLRI